MAAAFLSAGIFGRFFCSWGCHILALEDLCHWLLSKVGIRPKPVRSRVLLLVPPAALFYMIIWPQFARILEQRPLPQVQIVTDAAGWASFVTTNFWRNLPGPWIIALTFGVCGFAIIYLLGSRAFCLYGCPYSVIFRFADRFAPGRIKAQAECQQCGTCTATCTSRVRVHEEILEYGKVVDPACMKDLDCVSACPHDVLTYGFTRPALLKAFKPQKRGLVRFDFSDVLILAVFLATLVIFLKLYAAPLLPTLLLSAISGYLVGVSVRLIRPVRSDFTPGEEALMVATFIATLLVFRRLYDTVPFIMTLGLGGVVAYMAILGLRLIRRSDVRLNNFRFKQSGRLTVSGAVAGIVITAFAAFFVHSGFIRYHEFFGKRGFDRISAELAAGERVSPTNLAGALGHFEAVDRWGLFRSPFLDSRLASLYEHTDRPAAAEEHLRLALAYDPQDVGLHLSHGRMLTLLNRPAEAISEMRYVVEYDPPAGSSKDEQTKAAHSRTAAQLALGELLANTGKLEEAVEHLRAGLAAAPDSAEAHYNLAVILASLGNDDEALAEYRAALELNPDDADTHNNLGFLLAKRGDANAAAEEYGKALALNANFAAAHYNLGRLYQDHDKPELAAEHFQTAARLDPRYAEAIRRLEQSGDGG
jgi:tetratricopeptide (TPR) repeat protein